MEILQCGACTFAVGHHEDRTLLEVCLRYPAFGRGVSSVDRGFAITHTGLSLYLASLLLVAPLLAQQPQPAPGAFQQSITVTADRGLANATDSATSIATVTQQQMQQAPGLALDDRLHQVAGFMLFRRTSSWTANPTTEGVSLRGLGSTAASRTLVVSDQVPQNDPFGGWIHWDEIPALAIGEVNLLRGGSSDLYGSSAIGGVIDIVPADLAIAKTASRNMQFAADAAGATENSATEDALFTAATQHLLGLGAFSGFTTGGYIPTAPGLRGTVDTPSNVTGESGRIELRTPRFASNSDSVFLRGNLLNEARGNGTPLQTNATRLWRYQSGADFDSAHTESAIRVFGSREDYRQSFSSIAANRDSETLTKLQRVPTDEIGFALQASHAFRQQIGAALGLDLRDVRATDNESSASTGVVTSTSARQRELGGFADALWQPKNWVISGSVRADSFRTFTARQVASNAAAVTPLPEIDELFASPHLGIVRNLGANAGLTGNAFRAFRGPTMNELYRTGQVGSQTTLANDALLAERATGFEFGGFAAITQSIGLRASYFWTEVNRPISAVLLSQTLTTQTLQRQNLGQIRSRGLSLEAQLRRRHNFDAALNYQLAFATVTAFNSNSPAQMNLTGNWIPQVPREAVTSTANYMAPRVAGFHVIASYTGKQFDDAANQYVLHPYARFDVSADRDLGHGLSIFCGAQNLLNRTIDAGMTPILTLAAPRLVQGGLRFKFPG
jgi:outer membrane receptor protein involved in Fe transport